MNTPSTPTDYTPIVERLGTGSTLVLCTGDIMGESSTTRYDLVKMRDTGKYAVQAVNDLPASGPPIEFTPAPPRG